MGGLRCFGWKNKFFLTSNCSKKSFGIGLWNIIAIWTNARNSSRKRPRVYFSMEGEPTTHCFNEWWLVHPAIAKFWILRHIMNCLHQNRKIWLAHESLSDQLVVRETRDSCANFDTNWSDRGLKFMKIEVIVTHYSHCRRFKNLYGKTYRKRKIRFVRLDR